MLARRHIVLALLAIVCLFGISIALQAGNAEDQTAAALLQAGLNQLEQGQLGQARATLQRVDPVQLDRAQRQQLQEALRQLRAREAAQTEQEAQRQAEAEAEAQRRAEAEAEAQRRAEAEAEAQRRAAAEAEAQRQAEAEAEAQRRAEAEAAQARAEAEAEAQRQTEAQRRAEAEAEARRRAEQARIEQARAEAERARARQAQAAAEAEAQRRAEAEAAQARAEAEAEAQRRAEAEAEAQRRATAEAEAQRQAEAVSVPPAQEGAMRQAQALRAQQLVSQAQQAAAEGRYDQAAGLYEQALAIDPGNTDAQRGMQTVRAMQGRRTEQDLIGQVAEVYELRRQQTIAEYNDAINQANQNLQRGNYDLAEQWARTAQTKLQTNQQFLSRNEYTNMLDRARDLAAQVEQLQQRAVAEERARAAQQVQREQVIERQRKEQEREREVNILLRRALDLQRAQQYDQALAVLEQVLFIDPGNVAAQAMKENLEDTLIARDFRRIDRERDLNVQRQHIINFEQSNPPPELVQYPADWPQLTEMRLTSQEERSGESPQNRQVREALQQPIPVNFDNTNLQQAFEYLRGATGVNIVVNWRALEGAGIDQTTPVTLNLDNIPADQAIRMILDQVGGDLVPLESQVDAGVLMVATRDSLGRNTVIQTFDIRDLLVQAPNFTNAPVFDLAQITQTGGGGGSGTQGVVGGGGGGGIFDQGGGRGGGRGGGPADEQVGIPREVLVLQIMELVRDTVDPDSWRQRGGLVGSMSELNGTLIVSTTSENQRRVSNLLDQLRQTRALQIHVSARFLLVEQNFLDEIGLDMDITIGGLGSKFSPIVIDNNSIGIADRQGTGIAGSFGTAGAPGVVQITDPVGGVEEQEEFAFQRGTQVTAAFLSDIQVDLLVRATKANRRAVSLTAPNVTFSNGQRAFVVVANQIAFVTDLEPVVGTAAVGFDPDIGVISSGMVLDVEGTVSADRRYVTLTARPSLAAIGRIRQIPVGLAAGGVGGGVVGGGGGGAGTAVIESSLEAPELELTQVNTTVTIPDKGTLLLGGQRIMADIEIEAGVPVLSQLPGVNRLFTNRSTVKDERTLLILVKPTILIQAEKEDELFPGLRERTEQFMGASMP